MSYEQIEQLIDNISLTYEEIASGYSCLPGRALDYFSSNNLETQCPQITLKFYKFSDIVTIYDDYFRSSCKEYLYIPENMEPFPLEYEAHMFEIFQKYIPVYHTGDEINEIQKTYLDQFYICRLNKYDNIVHAAKISRLLKVEDGNLLFNEEGCWWNKYYVGQQDYKGGFFTYRTNYGGPLFGLDLVFNIEEPIPIFFIPPFYAEKYTDETNFRKNFASKNEILGKYIVERGFSGSHLFEGPETENRSAYSDLVRKKVEDYSDKLGVHFSMFNFTGFTSCDECEVFLTHRTMEKYNLKQPVSFNIDEQKLNIEANGLLQDPEKRRRIEQYILSKCFGKTNKIEITPIQTREFGEQIFDWQNINVIINNDV